jgi:hypothetical protein
LGGGRGRVNRERPRPFSTTTGSPARLGEQGTTARLDRQDRHLGPTGKGAKKWSNRWKAALNAFDITFDGRISATRR